MVGGTVDIDQRYVAPTVLSNVKVDSVVMQEVGSGHLFWCQLLK